MTPDIDHDLSIGPASGVMGNEDGFAAGRRHAQASSLNIRGKSSYERAFTLGDHVRLGIHQHPAAVMFQPVGTDKRLLQRAASQRLDRIYVDGGNVHRRPSRSYARALVMTR